MKRVGNAASNRLFNPQSAKASIPFDVDEIDGAMERFIRQKYEHRVFSSGGSGTGTRHNTGSTSSAEDRPPPLPPKPSKRFGFGLRAASSTFPMSRAENESPPVSPAMSGFGSEGSPPRANKASRVFGTTVRSSSTGSGGGDLEPKLATLREMGFLDDRRNLTVLKGLNGNLDKTIEQLIRLGEGGNPTHHAQPAPAPQLKAPVVNGITVERRRGRESPVKWTNPFDMPTEAQQQPTTPVHLNFNHNESNVTSGNTSPLNASNPFLAASRQAQPTQPMLHQSFQQLQLSPRQPLHPNSTGGSAVSNHQQYIFMQQSFQPSAAPYVTSPLSSPNVQDVFSSQQSLQPYQHHPPMTNGASNPFLRSTRSQVFTPSNPFNPPQTDVQRTLSYPHPTLHTTQGTFYSEQPVQVLQPVQQPSLPYQNPFYPQTQSALATSPPPPQYVASQGNPFPNRHDKNSILALYNFPNLAPRPGIGVTNSSTSPIKQRSVTLPVLSTIPDTDPEPTPTPSSLNPFANALQATNGTQQQSPSVDGGAQNGVHHTANGYPHTNGDAVHAGLSSPLAMETSNVNGTSCVGPGHTISRESVDFAGLMAGRHSPDAFAGLSARFVR